MLEHNQVDPFLTVLLYNINLHMPRDISDTPAETQNKAFVFCVISDLLPSIDQKSIKGVHNSAVHGLDEFVEQVDAGDFDESILVGC